ncbi:helix-turn-helix domain-containing protein [Streptococcus suis]|nr:helix-turn-helix domain-containing protein [Streptococcus suis]
MFSASKLKEHRLAKKLSQTAIANELGVTRATLSAWETGKTVPNKKHLGELNVIKLTNLSRFVVG